MRTISVCAGIGDNIWILQKLINSGEQFHFNLPDGRPQRGKQIFDLLPQVAASASYVPGLSYKKLKRENIQNKKRLWEQINEKEFCLSANVHLEQGKRIEDFLPDLPTSFKLPWVTTDKEVETASKRLWLNTKYIGIYGSSYSTSRTWGFWDERKWMELIRKIHEHDPEYKFVIIGAQWDLDLGRNLCRMLSEERIAYVDTIGDSLGTVVEIMKRLTYFFSFPSGLGILAPTVDCPVTMFYPDGKNGAPNLSKMMNAWASPDDIESGQYKGCLFCEPEAIFNWVVEHKKI